ncbi:MAG: hypothetical protein K9N51_09265 [Candidatus Pacebacteria bacterium]|nr:hypothetical protein [Candidatus Paceibacterota bacterium]
MRNWLLISGLWGSAIVIGIILSGTDVMQRRTAERHSVLELILGESRTVLSKKMFDFADLYFHGGVYVGHCTHGLHGEGATDHDEHNHDHDAEGLRGYTAVHRDGKEDEHHAHHAHDHADHAVDWWSAINNARIPHEHRHLRGERFEKEVLPWMWASIKSDPHNVLAFSVGSYWLVNRLDRPEEGLALIKEGIRNNPDDAELVFTLGTLQLHNFDQRDRALQAFKEARDKWRKQLLEWRRMESRSDADKPDLLLYRRILQYLARLSEQRGELATAANYYEEAALAAKGEPGIQRGLRQKADKLRATNVESGQPEN